MRRNKDTALLEEAYQKVFEDFNSERRLNAFSQNLQGRGFKVAYKDSTNNGEVHVLFNPQTSELIFVEVDASKNLIDGYVLTTDAAPKIVNHLRKSTLGFANLRELLDSLSSIDEIFASEMFPLKSYEEVFAQIGKRDRMYVDRS